MATMNPVDLYHDPALDDPIQPTKPPYRNGSISKRSGHPDRRPVSEDYGSWNDGLPSPATRASRVPPISYRGIAPDADPALHRSFSQRAKGRPFADEAFLDDERAEAKIAPEPQAPVAPAPMNIGVQPPQPAESLQSQQPSYEVQPSTQRHRRDVSTTVPTPQKRPPRAQNPQTPTEPRSTGMRAAARTAQNNRQDDQQANWTHDRSPLQKLEVKLTDISKEEKRARVQEAEMRFLRDQKSGKAPQRSRQSTGAAKLSEQDTPIAAAAPQSQPNPVSRSQNIVPTTPTTSPPAARKSMPQAQNDLRQISLDSSRDGGRTASDRYTPSESDFQTVQPQVARAVSLQQQKPRIRYRNEERPATQHERNASHQAALEHLTGARPERVKSIKSQPQTLPQVPAKNAAKRISSPVPVDLSTIAGPPNVTMPPNSVSKQNDTRQPPLPGAVLGLQQPKALRSVDSPPASLIDVSKHRQRKSSVSFKEPFDRRRPVDEWKNAGTACLSLEDFQTGQAQPADVKADKPDLTPWWERSPNQARRASQSRGSNATATTATVPTTAPPPIDDRTTQFSPRLRLRCGPLLRYTGLKRLKDDSKPESAAQEFWRGSIMIVTQDSQCSYDEFPTLRLFSQPKKLLPPPPALVHSDQLAPEYIDPIAGLIKLGRTGKATYVRPVDHLDVEKDVSRIEDDNGIYEASPSPLDGVGDKSTTSAATNKRTLDQDGERLGRFKEVKGVRIYADPDRDVTFWRFNIEVELGSSQQHIGYRVNKGAAMGFWVPAKGQTMNIMFHSCNGFSMSVNPNDFSGPDPMWRDVLNNHQTRPFHVMIGGGDQIYNDRVTADTQWFAGWTKIKNPHHKHQAPFTNEMKEELESFYLERYCMWFSQGLFALANSTIPMVNIWDDHDIIDGFGSYPHDFMKTPVFSGLGNIAYKYYMLFQHQSIDSMTDKDEPSWVLGQAPGPYIHTKSRSVFLELGQNVAFLGIDCRTERTRNDVMSIDTLELILDRCRRDMVEGRTKHLIVLLGVPIAYPRLVWLENVLTSKAMDPIKALGRAGILKSGFLNKFDGGVELLDDLDDHWTASHHKDERHVLIEELQDLAAEKSARITILSGDVHLAAVGQFYSNPKLKIPKDKDHRYMPNIISSAIVNTPPPDLMADVINKRNKIHHLDKYTDENMIPMFTHDVDHKRRNNTHLLPRRNWCSIREYFPGETPPSSPSLHSTVTDDEDQLGMEDAEISALDQPPKRRLSIGKADLDPRNLIRRLSSRKVPPTSYREDTGRPQQARSASFDGSTPQRGLSQESRQPQQPRASSMDHIADVKALRPSFHRRPTNLSEKAARKGLVSAVDADGNEVEVNDHINLEGGLDVVINCEVDRKDPSGITLPYRVLIPALWYDGSSDREKLDEVVKPSRRATVLNRFGLGMKPAGKASNRLDTSGSIDGDEGTESDDGHVAGNKPQRSFSFFRSRSKKESKPREMLTADNQHEDEPQQGLQQQAPAQEALASSNNQDRETSRLYNEIPARQSSRVPPTSHDQPYPPPPQGQAVQRGISQASRRSRPPSYTIGGTATANAQIPSPKPHEQFFSSEVYDADASYIESQQRALQSNRTSQSPQDARSMSAERQIPPQRRPSKQEEVLGIGAASDNYLNPSQSKLRGNGILGKNMPPSSFRSAQEASRPGSSSSENKPSQGYSGIEAYREPRSRRRWSLSIRDKARGLIDSLEGRRRERDDLYSDDDEEEFWEGPKQEYHESQNQQSRIQRPPPTPPQQVPPPQRPQQVQPQQLQQRPQQQYQQNPAGQQRSKSFRQWGPSY